MMETNTNSKVAQHILIDIDCLFDTRLATMADINQNAAIDLMNKGYHKRINDNFETFTKFVTHEEYLEAYRKRDDYILSTATLTEFAFDLYNIVEGIIKARTSNPVGIGGIRFFINTYPYKLSEIENIEIMACIQTYLPEFVPAEFVHLPLSEITTGYLKFKDIAGYFTYDLDMWANAVLKGQNPETLTMIPSVGIFPCMLTAKTHSEMLQVIQENKNHRGEEANPFEATALALASIIAVEWIPSHTYSAYGLIKASGETIEPTFRQ